MPVYRKAHLYQGEIDVVTTWMLPKPSIDYSGGGRSQGLNLLELGSAVWAELLTGAIAAIEGEHSTQRSCLGCYVRLA